MAGTELTTADAASVSAFRKALPLLDPPGIIVEGGTPGYLLTPAGSGPFKTILHIGGCDSTAEEMCAAVPDCARPGLGVRSPRRSGHRRLAALIADLGQIGLAEGLPGRLGHLWERVDDPRADDDFQALLQNPVMNTLFAPRMTTHGSSSVCEYVGEMRRYTARDRAPSITCPALITDNETDQISTGQGQELFERLSCPKRFRRFPAARRRRGTLRGFGPRHLLDCGVQLVGRNRRTMKL